MTVMGPPTAAPCQQTPWPHQYAAHWPSDPVVENHRFEILFFNVETYLPVDS
jgi:hypothetical protein